jgi:hypothetical protein
MRFLKDKEHILSAGWSSQQGTQLRLEVKEELVLVVQEVGLVVQEVGEATALAPTEGRWQPSRQRATEIETWFLSWMDRMNYARSCLQYIARPGVNFPKPKLTNIFMATLPLKDVTQRRDFQVLKVSMFSFC